jgi:hypothetical protein
MPLCSVLFAYHSRYKCVQRLLICLGSFKDASCSWSVPIFTAPTVSFIGEDWKFLSVVNFMKIHGWFRVIIVVHTYKIIVTEKKPPHEGWKLRKRYYDFFGEERFFTASDLFGKIAVGILALTPTASFVIEVFVIFSAPAGNARIVPYIGPRPTCFQYFPIYYSLML